MGDIIRKSMEKGAWNSKKFKGFVFGSVVNLLMFASIIFLLCWLPSNLSPRQGADPTIPISILLGGLIFLMFTLIVVQAFLSLGYVLGQAGLDAIQTWALKATDSLTQIVTPGRSRGKTTALNRRVFHPDGGESEEPIGLDAEQPAHAPS